jgi:lantibiotic modifying enzyme
MGGHIYSLTHLGALWQDDNYISLALNLVRKWAASIERDKHLNVLSGAAGYLFCLLNLYECYEHPTIMEAAIACGKHIIKQIDLESPFVSMRRLQISAGFAQGSAGIALALLKLFHYTHEELFYRTSIEFINYERQLMKQTDRPEATWCHGITGIGLARLHSLSHIDDPDMYSEIALATTTTLDRGFNRNHSLCHGDLGNIDFLYQAGRILQNEATIQEANNRVPQITSSIFSNGPICGLPHRIDAVGLMHGLAGIGFGLLRIERPHQVPSILSLDPPFKKIGINSRSEKSDPISIRCVSL